jgi:hypothetical protein
MLLEPTITSCYQPVENYLKLLRQAYPGGPEPLVNLKPLDAYLMWQLAACLPAAPTVIDLAADSTAGVSAILWLSHSGIANVVVPPNGHLPPNQPDWRTFLKRPDIELGLLYTTSLGDESLPDKHTLKDLAASIKPLGPILISLAETEITAANLYQRLNELLEAWPNAVIAVYNVGKIGESNILTTLLNVCSATPSYQLTALRESNPFFSASGLILLHLKANADLTGAFQRLNALYEGNFQFLSNLSEVARLTAVQNQLHVLQQQYNDLKRIEEVASREVEAVHNSKPWRFATWLWQWRVRIKQWLGMQA